MEASHKFSCEPLPPSTQIQHEVSYPVGEDASFVGSADADSDQLSPGRVELLHGVLQNRGQLPAATTDTAAKIQ